MTHDCTSCGTCCFSDLEDYVRVTGADHERLGERAEALAVFRENRAFMRMANGRCAALEIVPARGPGGTARYVCSIYAERPEICRRLERGSPECEGEIATKGDRPPRALRLLIP